MIISFKEYVKLTEDKDYTMSDINKYTRFRVTIHPSLSGWLEGVFKGKDIKYTRDGNDFDVTSNTGGITANSLQDIIYQALNTAFIQNDKTIVNFVGSNEVGDFIDTDFSINITLLSNI